MYVYFFYMLKYEINNNKNYLNNYQHPSRIVYIILFVDRSPKKEEVRKHDVIKFI